MKKIPLKPAFFCLFFYTFYSTFCVAKGDTVRQYLNGGEISEPALAFSYRIAIKQEGVWYFSEYYTNEQTIKTEGSYADDSFKVKIGSFIEYYPDGKIKERCRYIDNKKTGLLRHYSKQGHLTDSAFYLNDIPMTAVYEWYPDGHIWHRGIFDKEGTGTGEETEFYEDSSISAYGKYSVGYKKDSVWTYYHSNGIVSYREYFDQGILKKSECYDSNGIAQTHCDPVKMPEPGFDIHDYLAKNLHFPTGYNLKYGKGRVTVKLTIYEDGSLHDLEVIQKLHPAMDAAVVDVLRKMPRWKPGKDHNRLVKVYYTLPVLYKQE